MLGFVASLFVFLVCHCCCCSHHADWVVAFFLGGGRGGSPQYSSRPFGALRQPASLLGGVLRVGTHRGTPPVSRGVTTMAATEAVAKPLPPRSEVPVDDTWAVESIFPSVDAFDAELAALTDLSAGGKWPSLMSYRGTLASAGPAGVVALLDEYFAISRRIQVLYTYGHLQHDTDTADDAKKAAYGRAVSVYYGFAEATSWMDSELVALPEAEAATLMASPEVAAAGYGFHLEKIFRNRAHTLSAEGEALIAMAGKSMGAATKAFGALNNADLTFEAIRDGKGDRHEVTLGNYIGHMRSRDRRRREAAFKSLYGAYGAHENTLAELLGGVVERNVFTARARKYDGVLHSALAPNGIPTSVYTSLLETVRKALPRTMHKYAKLRRRLLHAQSPAVRTFNVHYWDLYAPLIPDVDIKFSYDAARAAVVESVAPLGDEYQEMVRAGLYEKRWVDRFENLNKVRLLREFLPECACWPREVRSSWWCSSGLLLTFPFAAGRALCGAIRGDSVPASSPFPSSPPCPLSSPVAIGGVQQWLS